MANSLTHVLPYPIKKARFSLILSFRVAAGTPTDPTTPDTEKSTDGGATFSDCTEEITTGGANGLGYITLTGAETDNAAVALAAKSANCVTTPVIVYPRELPIISNGTASAGAAGSITIGTILAYDITGCFVRTTGGTGGGGAGGANNQARKITAYNTGTGVATVLPNWETIPDATTTYDILLPEEMSISSLLAINPATPGRKPVVDPNGLMDANAVKVGPTGAGVAQTALDLAANWTAARAAKVDNLDVAVSTRGTGDATIANQTVINNNVLTRLATAGYTVPPTTAQIATAIFTDLLAGADFGTAASIGKLLKDNIDAVLSSLAASHADKLLGRNLAGASDGGRTVQDALRGSRNKVAFDVPGIGQFTVYKEDDVTVAWTGTYTSSVGASPVTTIDPV